MRKIKVSEEEIEFLEEKEVISLFDNLSQTGVSKKVVNRTKKRLLKQTAKAEKIINKGRPDSIRLRSLRQSTKCLQDMFRDPSSYPPKVAEEMLKAL